MSYCLRPHRWENSQKNHIGIKFGVNTELFNGSLPKIRQCEQFRNLFNSNRYLWNFLVHRISENQTNAFHSLKSYI